MASKANLRWRSVIIDITINKCKLCDTDIVLQTVGDTAAEVS
jgi:hypothetical protein